MALAARFSLLNSSYNDFLHSAIGDEHNGVALSVMSALVRLDLDPWAEARRLALLPATQAAQQFAGVIAKVSPTRWQPEEASIIATRLVGLLPAPERILASGRAPGRQGGGWRYAAALAIAGSLLVAVIVMAVWLR
jgi:hypothetical protein